MSFHVMPGNLMSRQFRSVPVTAFVFGMSAGLVAYVGYFPLVSMLLLAAPGLVHRSERGIFRAMRDGLLIWVIALMVAIPFAIDNRTTVPIVWEMLPTLVFANPVPPPDVPIPFWVYGIVVYVQLTMPCFLRLSSLMNRTPLLDSRNMGATLISTPVATLLFCLSWQCDVSEFGMYGFSGDLRHYLLSLFFMCLSWAVGAALAAWLSEWRRIWESEDDS